jgi:hypothetical protein
MSTLRLLMSVCVSALALTGAGVTTAVAHGPHHHHHHHHGHFHWGPGYVKNVYVVQPPVCTIVTPCTYDVLFRASPAEPWQVYRSFYYLANAQAAVDMLRSQGFEAFYR